MTHKDAFDRGYKQAKEEWKSKVQEVMEYEIEFYHRFEPNFILKEFLNKPDEWNDFDKWLLTLRDKLLSGKGNIK